MSFLDMISVSSATHESTLNDAVQGIVDNPEEAAVRLGDFFQNLLESFLHAVPTILFAALVLLVGLVVCRFTLKILSKGLDRTRLDITVTNFTKQCCRIVLYVLLVTVVLSVLGIPATSIITVIGTAGVAIGLALQDSLSNVAGGILLMINKPFKIGDYITVGDVSGTVKQIAILYTRLDSSTNQAIFIPNGQVSNAVVVNNNGNETRRVDMTFQISYDDDFEKAREIICELLSRNEKVMKSPAPLVRMLEHGTNAIVIAVRPWVKCGDYWDVFFSMNEQVRSSFEAAGITVPYNQMNVHVVKD